jgi:hypothetical protein
LHAAEIRGRREQRARRETSVRGVTVACNDGLMRRVRRIERQARDRE